MGFSPAKRPFHYVWIVAALTFLTLLIGAGVRATPSVLTVPLERDFHWSRATISFTISVNLMLYGLIGPFAAELMNRFGVRRVIAGSLVLVSTAVALTTRMSASWQLVVLWGVLVGSGTGMTALVLGATIVNRWFTAQRGVVMGVLTASTATGQLIFLPILAALVERHGWRSAALLIAGCAAAVIPFALLFIRERPADLGLLPYGEVSTPNSESAVSPARESARRLALGCALVRFLAALCQLLHLRRQHQRPDWHASHPSLHGPRHPRSQSRRLARHHGYLRPDRNHFLRLALRPFRQSLFARVVLRSARPVAALSPLQLQISFYGLSLFAVFYGLDWIATVPPPVRLTANLFGKERSSIVFGWIVAGHQLGAALAAFGAGAIRTYLGNYTRVFLLAGLMCVTATLVVLPIGRRPKVQPPLPVLVSAELMASTQEILEHHLKCFLGLDLEGILADYAQDAILFTPFGTLKGRDRSMRCFRLSSRSFRNPVFRPRWKANSSRANTPTFCGTLNRRTKHMRPPPAPSSSATERSSRNPLPLKLRPCRDKLSWLGPRKRNRARKQAAAKRPIRISCLDEGATFADHTTIRP